jgi:hypothetical protein
MVSLAEVGEESLEHWKELVDLGDHLFVSGEVISSRRGELSIMATSWKVAAKALLPLPNLHKELNEETRVRSRYLDLIVREQARATVLTRATAVSSLRATFAALDFVEVETPMLQVMHGGAAARPFATHSNAFDMELFLRIAPELFLKRAVVGGIDRVFEINRNFRNEGADSTHSPEFAMLEAYEAYGDYTSIAALTQRLIQEAATAVAGSVVAQRESRAHAPVTTSLLSALPVRPAPGPAWRTSHWRRERSPCPAVHVNEIRHSRFPLRSCGRWRMHRSAWTSCACCCCRDAAARGTCCCDCACAPRIHARACSSSSGLSGASTSS